VGTKNGRDEVIRETFAGFHQICSKKFFSFSIMVYEINLNLEPNAVFLIPLRASFP